MITNELIMYLDNKDISKEKKQKLLINLNLSYSDLLMLMEIYKDNGDIHAILYKEFNFYSDVFKNRLKQPKKDKVKKFKLKRRIQND